MLKARKTDWWKAERERESTFDSRPNIKFGLAASLVLSLSTLLFLHPTLHTPCRTVMIHEPYKMYKEPGSSLSGNPDPIRTDPQAPPRSLVHPVETWAMKAGPKGTKRFKAASRHGYASTCDTCNANDRNISKQHKLARICQDSGWGDRKMDAKAWENIIDMDQIWTKCQRLEYWGITGITEKKKRLTTGNVRQCDNGQFGDRRVTEGRMWGEVKKFCHCDQMASGHSHIELILRVVSMPREAVASMVKRTKIMSGHLLQEQSKRKWIRITWNLFELQMSLT